MPRQPLQIERAFAPRWTFRSVLSAGTITLGLYVLLPWLETLTPPPEEELTLRRIDTAAVAPPPPAPPEPKVYESVSAELSAPEPKLEMPQQPLTPLVASMNLEMAIGDLAGDFAMGFEVTGDELTQQVASMVFEIGELDEPPRPVSRMPPLYPPRAKVRRIEGFAVVEFLVNREGEVSDVKVTQSQPAGIFSEAAMKAVRRWKFQPGKKNGEAVVTRVRQRLNFSLD